MFTPLSKPPLPLSLPPNLIVAAVAPHSMDARVRINDARAYYKRIMVVVLLLPIETNEKAAQQHCNLESYTRTH